MHVLETHEKERERETNAGHGDCGRAVIEVISYQTKDQSTTGPRQATDRVYIDTAKALHRMGRRGQAQQEHQTGRGCPGPGIHTRTHQRSKE